VILLILVIFKILRFTW